MCTSSNAWYRISTCSMLAALLVAGCNARAPETALPQAPQADAPPAAQSSADVPAPSEAGSAKPATPPASAPTGLEPLLGESGLDVPAPGDMSFEPLTAEPSVAGSDAPYWPRFHGPDGDNLSPDTGLMKQWPEGGPRLVWTAKGLGSGFSSVSTAGGLMYTAGNTDDKTVVTALDLNGQIQWQVPNGEAWTGDHPGTRGTPTVDGDRLYHQSPVGNLACLNAKTGEEIWGLNVLKKYGSQTPRWALAESVLVDGDRVISTPGGPNTAMVALDKLSGEPVWQSESADGDLAGYATPTLVEYQGKRLLFTLTAKAIICVDADSGKLYFRFPHETSYDVNVMKPIFHDGQVFVSTGYGTGGRMLKVTIDGQRVTAEQLWLNKDLDNHHGGVVLKDGYLYGSNFKSRWVCLEWASGKTMYEDKGVGKGALTWADGMIYALGEKSRMGLMRCAPDAPGIVSDFELPKGGDGPSWAHPVVIGGRLYVRHDDFLYCYDVRGQGVGGGE